MLAEEEEDCIVSVCLHSELGPIAGNRVDWFERVRIQTTGVSLLLGPRQVPTVIYLLSIHVHRHVHDACILYILLDSLCFCTNMFPVPVVSPQVQTRFKRRLITCNSHESRPGLITGNGHESSP